MEDGRRGGVLAGTTSPGGGAASPPPRLVELDVKVKVGPPGVEAEAVPGIYLAMGVRLERLVVVG